MNEHENYMADFMKVFEALDRWGPGSEEDTLRARSLLPDEPKSILEIGSGKGLSTLILARNTEASITAVDNEPVAIDGLKEIMENHGLASRVDPVCGDMTELPFEDAGFDLIWAEACAYIMGVTNALAGWKCFLRDEGFLVLSDLVWLTDQQSQKSQSFWKNEYPDMQNIPTRLKQMWAAGYEVLDHFSISLDSWRNYIDPLRARVKELEPVMENSVALEDLKTELNIYEHYLGDEFGYQFFILQKKG